MIAVAADIFNVCFGIFIEGEVKDRATRFHKFLILLGNLHGRQRPTIDLHLVHQPVLRLTAVPNCPYTDLVVLVFTQVRVKNRC